MPMPKPILEARLKAAFPLAEIAVQDTAGDEDHYAVSIACPSFAGLSKIAQHRKVQTALPELQNGTLHALSLTTKALA